MCACDRDDLNGSGNAPDKNAAPPRFYGWMTLSDAAPETRGVANSSKVWSRPIAEKNLTVKFLNGTERYQEFVKEVAHEWEKYANVRFRFVPDDQEALVRVGFDYVKGMSSSWALTGTDHLQQYGNQDEATVHFAQWRRASDAAKRSDVLRAFGQVLGLELEFRHPSFYPAWITDEDGNIDEETIREYWEYELNELISWEELKKVVLDPLNVPAFLLEKTEYYDQNSVMSWPFYEMIAQNIPIVEFDEDYRTELSAQDKKFIERLYGEPQKIYDDVEYVKLIEFDYTGTRVELSLEVTENVFVIWDGDKEEILKDEVTYVEPVEGKILKTQRVVHTYADNKKHKVIIAQLHAYGQTPTESSALKSFDLTTGVGMENLDLHPEVSNVNLSCVRVKGGTGFKEQQLDFLSNNYLKELYLSEIGNSKVTIDNCPNLEIFATTPSFAAIDLLTLKFPNAEMNVDMLSEEVDDGPLPSLIFNEPELKVSFKDFSLPPFEIDTTLLVTRKIYPWPQDPQQNYSLSDEGGAGLCILNCPNLKKLCLEHTRIQNFNFANLPNLESVYLSSMPEYLVGGGTPEGNNLRVALNTLQNRTNTSTGQIIIRGMRLSPNFLDFFYKYSSITFDPYYINLTVTRKNWAICWDPKMTYLEISEANL